jgi:hypothetical protein
VDGCEDLRRPPEHTHAPGHAAGDLADEVRRLESEPGTRARHRHELPRAAAPAQARQFRIIAKIA